MTLYSHENCPLLMLIEPKDIFVHSNYAGLTLIVWGSLLSAQSVIQNCNTYEQNGEYTHLKSCGGMEVMYMYTYIKCSQEVLICKTDLTFIMTLYSHENSPL